MLRSVVNVSLIIFVNTHGLKNVQMISYLFFQSIQSLIGDFQRDSLTYKAAHIFFTDSKAIHFTISFASARIQSVLVAYSCVIWICVLIAL